jgi:hypothetical protein
MYPGNAYAITISQPANRIHRGSMFAARDRSEVTQRIVPDSLRGNVS